ncbi:hypothetical protein CANCADRAFT_29929 [Tortispora caseinolytica NRRL Y-17796]|uniref:Uncharacterized protein n=1 Tax=Tortispora caseinolytica NRRL Y-17796 TaxID=767744 RepID=A0A1E4TIC9_9ASCO|nr:hypothetical protein CANCADRAFT_29929 [Tortispora caseinolytica NRRL Y-17796]
MSPLLSRLGLFGDQGIINAEPVFLSEPPVLPTVAHERHFASESGRAVVFGEDCQPTEKKVDGWYCNYCAPVTVTTTMKPPLVADDQFYTWEYYEVVSTSTRFENAGANRIEVPTVMPHDTNIPKPVKTLDPFEEAEEFEDLSALYASLFEIDGVDPEEIPKLRDDSQHLVARGQPTDEWGCPIGPYVPECSPMNLAASQSNLVYMRVYDYTAPLSDSIVQNAEYRTNLLTAGTQLQGENAYFVSCNYVPADNTPLVFECLTYVQSYNEAMTNFSVLGAVDLNYTKGYDVDAWGVFGTVGGTCPQITTVGNEGVMLHNALGQWNNADVYINKNGWFPLRLVGRASNMASQTVSVYAYFDAYIRTGVNVTSPSTKRDSGIDLEDLLDSDGLGSEHVIASPVEEEEHVFEKRREVNPVPGALAVVVVEISDFDDDGKEEEKVVQVLDYKPDIILNDDQRKRTEDRLTEQAVERELQAKVAKMAAARENKAL